MAVDATDVAVRFSEVSVVTPRGDGTFDAALSEHWTIGGKPNGGYLLALLARAATATVPHPHPIAASAHFVRSPAPGPVVITTTVLRAGRTASQVRTSLHQGDVLCVESLITASHLTEGAAPYWDTGAPPMPAASFESCARLVPNLPTGLPVAIMEHVGVHLEPAAAGFTEGRPRGDGVLSGWLTLPDSEPFDPLSLIFAIDAYPPATFDVEFSGWVPTLELTAYVRALPAPGPVRVCQRAHVVADRRVDESCTVWDAAGTLVAQGTQLAGIRLG